MAIRGIVVRSASLWLCLAWLAGQCLAQGAPFTLREKEAVDRALNRPALQAFDAGTLEAAAGEIVQARTLPNPVLGLERQTLNGAADERETNATISQRFDIGGKRGLRIDAASERLVASQADLEARRKSIAIEVRRRFHEALAMQLGAAALESWERRLEEAESLALKLQKGGEAAGYDRRRVGRERATASSRVKAARADMARTVDALRALIGADSGATYTLAGSVLPDPLAPLESYLANLEIRPDLKALAARASAFRYDETLARRGRIPDLTVSAGVRQVDRAALSDSGVILGVSIPLPIFERGEAGSRRAAGQAQAAAAERAIALAKAQGDVRGLWHQAMQLRAAAEEFRREAVDASRRLTEIARAAYRGGEVGILELLDSHRSLLEAETRALELELAARAASLELELVTAGESR
jgi:cobalt-zinc-cadmium efflux system outer membrane protein